MKVLFIQPRRTRTSGEATPIFVIEPLWAEYLGAGLKDAHDTRLLDMRVERTPLADTARGLPARRGRHDRLHRRRQHRQAPGPGSEGVRSRHARRRRRVTSPTRTSPSSARRTSTSWCPGRASTRSASSSTRGRPRASPPTSEASPAWRSRPPPAWHGRDPDASLAIARQLCASRPAPVGSRPKRLLRQVDEARGGDHNLLQLPLPVRVLLPLADDRRQVPLAVAPSPSSTRSRPSRRTTSGSRTTRPSSTGPAWNGSPAPSMARGIRKNYFFMTRADSIRRNAKRFELWARAGLNASWSASSPSGPRTCSRSTRTPRSSTTTRPSPSFSRMASRSIRTSS